MRSIRERLIAALFILLIVVVFAATFALVHRASAYAATSRAAVKEEVGIGGQIITNPTTATFLTVPAGATNAFIYVKNKPVCYSFDATAPTSTSPGEWPAGFILKIDNDALYLKVLRVINCADGATTVKVYYSRERRVGE